MVERTWQSLYGQDSVSLYKLRTAMQNIVNEANHQLKLDLFRAHPELAGKAAIDGNLTVESTEEQESAVNSRSTSNF